MHEGLVGGNGIQMKMWFLKRFYLHWDPQNTPLQEQTLENLPLKVLLTQNISVLLVSLNFKLKVMSDCVPGVWVGHLHIKPWLAAINVGQWTPERNCWSRIRLGQGAISRVTPQTCSLPYAWSITLNCQEPHQCTMCMTDNMKFWNLGTKDGSQWFDWVKKSPSSEYIQWSIGPQLNYPSFQTHMWDS